MADEKTGSVENTDENKEISLDIPGAPVSTEPKPVNREEGRSVNRAEEAMRLVRKVKVGNSPEIKNVGKEPKERIIKEPKEQKTNSDGVPIYDIVIAKYTSFEIGGAKKEFLQGKKYTVTKEIKDLLVKAGVVAK